MTVFNEKRSFSFLIEPVPTVKTVSQKLSCLVAMVLIGWSNCPADNSTTKSKSGRMVLEVEINRPAASRRYRKPYVAVWVEDGDKYPVKTIALWIMQNRPGPRWYPDLKQWYRGDRMRSLVDEKDLIDGMSSATRSPGKYKVAWDGTDDAGVPLPPGKYNLLIESAREHGTYQLIKQEFEIGKSLKKQLKGNSEIKSVSVDYKATSEK